MVHAIHQRSTLAGLRMGFSGDVNPPVARRGAGVARVQDSRSAYGAPADRAFLESAFHKLLPQLLPGGVNPQKDAEGMNNLPGWLPGLGQHWRVRTDLLPCPTGGDFFFEPIGRKRSWMGHVLPETCWPSPWELGPRKSIPPYDNVASKFFEHFVSHIRASHEQPRSPEGIETLGQIHDGFYYDCSGHLPKRRSSTHLKVRSARRADSSSFAV